MDDAARQVRRPDRCERSRARPRVSSREARRDLVGARFARRRTAAASRRSTARWRGAAQSPRPPRCMRASASPTARAMARRRPAQPHAVEKGDDRGGAAGQPPERRAVARSRTGCGQLTPRARQMLHQAEEERQVVLVHALFVERQDEWPASRAQQVVGVLDALGDALERQDARRGRNRRGTRPSASSVTSV